MIRGGCDDGQGHQVFVYDGQTTRPNHGRVIFDDGIIARFYFEYALVDVRQRQLPRSQVILE